MGSIPASQIVSVTPSVLSAGGQGLTLNGLVLTQNTLCPMGTVLPFPSAAAVGAYFGPSAAETAIANVYFAGFTGCNTTPGSLFFAQYAETSVNAYLRGGQVTATLAQLQALTGGLTIYIDGLTHTVPSVSLSAQTSMSAIAAYLTSEIALSIPVGSLGTVTFTFNSTTNSFVADTGYTGTVAFAAGALATALNLTQAAGAVLSQGSLAQTPATAMAAICDLTTNWASFMTAWASTNTEIEAFSAWNTEQNGRYLYSAWTTDNQCIVAGSTLTAAYAIGPFGSNSNGTAISYAPVNGALTAAFVLGYVASLDFTELNGRATAAFRSQSGLSPDVTSGVQAANLQSNGINYYGSFSTASQAFTFLYNGSVTGPYAWIDSYVNAIWLNNALQLAIMMGLTQSKSVPYNAPGYATVVSWLTDPVMQAVNFGAINAGTALSAAQISEVNTAAGQKIDTTLTNQGYCIQVQPAIAQTRGLRQSPPCTLFYCDAGSIQNISLSSIEVQ